MIGFDMNREEFKEQVEHILYSDEPRVLPGRDGEPMHVSDAIKFWWAVFKCRLSAPDKR